MIVKLILPRDGKWSMQYHTQFVGAIEKAFAQLNPSAPMTVGTQTATWTAPTNKPGVASGAVVAWQPVALKNGGVGYIPVFQ